MENGEEKQATEDDKCVESPNAVLVFSKTITALMPQTRTWWYDKASAGDMFIA